MRERGRDRKRGREREEEKTKIGSVRGKKGWQTPDRALSDRQAGTQGKT